jgi:hypothetical protein
VSVDRRPGRVQIDVAQCSPPTGTVLIVGHHPRGAVVVMAFVAGLIAASVGVLLAALDSPHVHDRARLKRWSIALLTATAAVGAASAVLQWVAA